MRVLGNQRQQGFTLLEILVALTIVSILAMIAIPFYQDYRSRAKVGGEIGLISPFKNLVTENYYYSGVWLSSNADASLGDPSDYHGEWVESIALSDVPAPGAIVITYDNNKIPALGGNNTLTFYPQANNGQVSWLCNAGTMENYYRPKNCHK